MASERLVLSSPLQRMLCGISCGAALLCFGSRIDAQSISTYVGGGPLGDGKSATEALLTAPNDMTLDPDGNLFIAERLSHRVRRIDTNGTITTYAGGGTSGLLDGGPATEAELFRPQGVALDAAGNLYIAEGSHHRVRKVDASTGIITTVAGGGSDWGDSIPGTEARLAVPVDVEIGPDGNLYIAEARRHLIRKLDLSNGIVTTAAGIGTEGFSGDGGPATMAELNQPFQIVFGPNGDLFIADQTNQRVRKVAGDTGVISTVFTTDEDVSGVAVDGNILYVAFGLHSVFSHNLDTGEDALVAGASRGFSGDGGPATEAALQNPTNLFLEPDGDLLIADTFNTRIRRVSAETKIITTIAGGGSVGDGGPATSAHLTVPTHIALTPEGDLVVGELGGQRVRRVSASTGIITTIAGDGVREFSGDRGPAKDARVTDPRAIGVDSLGNVYIGTFDFPEETGSRIRKIDAASGIITTIAGGGQSVDDGIPATQALLWTPSGIAIDDAQNVYVSFGDFDEGAMVIRRIDAENGVITTIAGTAFSPGDSGDGGPATEALFNAPQGIAFDPRGNLFVADQANHRIRKIDFVDGTVSTVAGTGVGENTGDGGPAVDAGLRWPTFIDFDADGNLFIFQLPGAFQGFNRIRRVDADSGVITTVVGGETGVFRGDGGPATRAGIFSGRGLAVDATGSIFECELSNRVRVVYACGEVAEPQLLTPVNGSVDTDSAPTLSWEAADRAFRYDVLLAAAGTVGSIAASDLTATAFTPANLEPGTTYYWRVVAKGDSFCDPAFEALSPVFSFATAPSCEAPPRVSLSTPGDGAVIAATSAVLTWNPVSGAESYDVFLGTSSPPSFFRSTNSTSLRATNLVPGNDYFWSVVAHATCDSSQTTRSEARSFFLAGPCDPAGAFAPLTPSDGVFNVPTTSSLSWSTSPNATSYDFFLGTTNPPPLFLPGLTRTSVRLSGLDSITTYYWRLKANIDCDDAKSLTTDVVSFTTVEECRSPQRSSILFTPPGGVEVGQTYAITWGEARGLDAGGYYVVERSLDVEFSSILDSRETSTTSATFLAGFPGVHYHRVRPVTGCNASVTGPYSSTATVNVVDESPNVIFTVEPAAVINTPGRNLEDLRTTFTIENISSEAVTAIVGRTEIESDPFFTIVDPLGGDSAFVTLQPRVPKTLEVRFSGPPNDFVAAYQGLVVVTTAGSPVVPYAFVNLKIGDSGSAGPEFRVSGIATEYASFPGLDGNDADRPPIVVEIHNPGTTPMELGAEIGPEIWLEPEAGWNGSPIPPGATRGLKLFTSRTRALNGSALPRYTYFTVRTKTGETARLLLQDNSAASIGVGRTSVLEPNVTSFIIPEALSEVSAGGTTLVSKVRLTNLGTEPVQAELLYTPSGADGFDVDVQHAIVVIPPNDVASLTDPLMQVFGRTRPAMGQLEIRADVSKIGLLRVDSVVVPGDRADSSFSRIPIVRRGDGARAGLPHLLPGVTATANETTAVVLAETSGTDGASLNVALYDDSGSLLGQKPYSIARYGHIRVDDIVRTLGGTSPFSAGRLTITVVDGGGSVAALARIQDSAAEHAAVFSSFPVEVNVSKMETSSIRRRTTLNGATASLVAPYVASGPIGAGNVDHSTLMGFLAPFGIDLDFGVIFTDASGNSFEKTVSVSGGAVREFRNVLRNLFEIEGTTEGWILVEGDPRGRVYMRLVTNGQPAGSLELASPVSELVTVVTDARPLYVDGLEQSTDPTRGSHWKLYLTEIAGEPGVVTVRLYEAGNRRHPISVSHFSIAANGRLALETIFDAMNLNTDQRRKNRTNVLCMVTPGSGGAMVTGVAIEVDNLTGTVTGHTLKPASGLPSSADPTSLVRVVDPGGSTRLRPVRRSN